MLRSHQLLQTLLFQHIHIQEGQDFQHFLLWLELFHLVLDPQVLLGLDLQLLPVLVLILESGQPPTLNGYQLQILKSSFLKLMEYLFGEMGTGLFKSCIVINRH